MTTKTFDLCAVYSERDGAQILNYAVVPLSMATLLVALIAIFAPWVLPLVALVTGLSSWLYLQLIALIVVIKMISSAIYFVAFGDHDDLYE